jgi:hypothetical protein
MIVDEDGEIEPPSWGQIKNLKYRNLTYEPLMAHRLSEAYK